MFKNFLKPIGKVNNKYNQFIKWSFISNIVSTIEDSLGTHSMLSSLGSVNNDIIVSYNYIGKNMIGQLGGLFFVLKIGNKIDKEPKKYLIKSVILNQVSIYLDCLIPLFHSNVFLIVAGCSNIFKNIAWVGYGAVNTRIIQKLAEEDNISEIYTKISFVNTLASSVGMLIGLTIAYKIPCHHTRLCILPFLTCIRIYTYNKAIQNIL